MWRKSDSGRVRAKGANCIEFTIWYYGKRYRPTINCPSTAANLKRAEKRLNEINERIRDGTFKFSEEFPDYRYMGELPNELKGETSERSCDEVFDSFLSYCEVRVAQGDMALSTFIDYRKILKRSWQPKLGPRPFTSVTYSELLQVATGQGWATKKTYNNGISVIRCAFEFGYRDYPSQSNPAKKLECFRITKRDRPEVDPFDVQEAETIITGMHVEFGEPMGNFDEFRFFTGLRHSEEMGLRTRHCDLEKGKITICETVVRGQDKDRPKTGEDRTVELCPRALAVLKRQFALRAVYEAAGKLKHDFVFFQDDGKRITSPSYPYRRWTYVIKKVNVRYREPYNARHTYASWQLMIGKNPSWVSNQLGNSVPVLYERYGKWIEGATEADLEAIRQAMQAEPTARRVSASDAPTIPCLPRETATKTATNDSWGRLSWRKRKQEILDESAGYIKTSAPILVGGADGTRTRDPRRDRPVF